MKAVLDYISTMNISEWISAITGLLTAVIGVCLMIPGEQPEKFLQGVVDFLKKISAK